MRIGELSRRTGVSIRSLRYYEEQGLLKPLRQPSGYREYRDEDARTVRGIRLLLAGEKPVCAGFGRCDGEPAEHPERDAT